jgi:hypothetical protein
MGSRGSERGRLGGLQDQGAGGQGYRKAGDARGDATPRPG